ncbi:hypothetical protein [Mycobacterium lepromatosis]|uniref:hypothetical protein n=1 Tax=Mycobacterium lepromatosis TaxID=480418 RepID=UPI0012E0BBB3|nr:hypothetical protein [Mycobacterium lepromatosis]
MSTTPTDHITPAPRCCCNAALRNPLQISGYVTATGRTLANLAAADYLGSLIVRLV